MDQDVMHEELEGQHARSELYRAAKMSAKLFKMIDDHQELEPWVLSKAVKAADYLDTIYHYLEYQTKFADGQEANSIDDLIGDTSSLSKRDELLDLETDMDDIESLDVDLDDLEDENDDFLKKESAYNDKLDAIIESAVNRDDIKQSLMQSIKINGIERTIANVKQMIGSKSISESVAQVYVDVLKEAASCKKEAVARKEKRKAVVSPKKTEKKEPAKEKPRAKRDETQLDEQVINESTDLQDILRLSGRPWLHG